MHGPRPWLEIMSEKKVPKKLHKGEQIMVSDQIIRWRSKLRREGIVLGKAMQKAKERAASAREDRKINSKEKLTKKKWFG